MFGRATIRLGIGPHSSSYFFTVKLPYPLKFYAYAFAIGLAQANAVMPTAKLI